MPVKPQREGLGQGSLVHDGAGREWRDDGLERLTQILPKLWEPMPELHQVFAARLQLPALVPAPIRRAMRDSL
jgi:hypothetical protein